MYMVPDGFSRILSPSLILYSQFSAKANFLRKKFSKRSFSDSSADRRPLDPEHRTSRRCIRRGDAVVVEGDDDDGREEGGGKNQIINIFYFPILCHITTLIIVQGILHICSCQLLLNEKMMMITNLL